MKRTTTIVIVLILLVLSGCLLFLCFDSVTTPIKFLDIKNRREAVIIEQLKDIRAAEMAFNNAKGHYTNSFKELQEFLLNDSASVVAKIGEINDSLMEAGVTSDKKAMDILNAKGKKNKELYNLLVSKGFLDKTIFCRDTTKVPMMQAVFGDRTVDVSTLSNVPYSDPVDTFEIKVGVMNSGGIDVPIIWCGIGYDSYLGDLDKQEIANLKAQQEEMKKYPGLKFGDISKVTNNVGSWE